MKRARQKLRLAELIDLESQLLQDSKADPFEVRRRDRRIGRLLDSKALTREQLLLAWLRKVRPAGELSVGERLETAFRWLRLLFLAIGFVTGASTARLALAYDGSSPVNVVHFLAIFVGLQLLMLIVLLISFLPVRWTSFLPGKDDLLKLLRELGYLLGRRLGKTFTQASSEQQSAFFAELNRLRTHRHLYGGVERWLLLGLTQRAGLAFNLGALLTCLYLIVFSDIAFAWNTTLQIEPAFFHRITDWISAPWALFVPSAVPSLELVESTRYFRLGGEYVQPDSSTPQALTAGGWWPFLIMALLCYGLLPRMLALLVATLRYHRARRRLAFDAAEFQSLYDRLTLPLVETRALTDEPDAPPHPAAVAAAAPLPVQGVRCDLVLWGEMEIPQARAGELVKRRFGWELRHCFRAGGFDIEQDRKTWEEISEGKGEKVPLLVLVESWEAPSKSILYFLQQVRERVDNRRHFVVGLVNTVGNGAVSPPAQDDWRSWAETLASLGDPYLRVEALVETP